MRFSGCQIHATCGAFCRHEKLLQNTFFSKFYCENDGSGQETVQYIFNKI